MEARLTEATREPRPSVVAYFDFCEKFKSVPVPSVVIALQYEVSYLLLDQGFQQGDLIALCEALKGNKHVASLDLRRCQVGSPGCYALRDLFQFNDTLRHLNLSQNDIGEHGAQALAQGLSANTTVERLYLRGNRIGIAGAVSLGNLIRSTASLKVLDVSNNYLKWDSVVELRRAMDERATTRARARHRARQLGQLQGAADIKVRDIEVVLSGNLVMEEITSSVMHGTGLVLSIIGAFPLFQVARASKDAFHFWGVVVYTVALLAMYLSTTLGHSFFQYQRASVFFRAVDRSVIYLLIAGTYTPFLLVNMRSEFAGQVGLVCMWSLALLGICLSLCSQWWARQRFYLYIIVAACSVAGFRSIVTCIHPNGVMLLAGGVALFLIALMAYRVNRVHLAYLMCLVGTTLHYFAVLFHTRPCEADSMSSALTDRWL